MECRYILDANIFIEAKNNAFPFDIVPSFWEHLLEHAQNNNFFLIQEVINEICQGEDNLSAWLKANISSFAILPNTEQMYRAATDVSTYIVQNSHYLDSAKNEFLAVADFYLVSYALAHGCVVVTNEKINLESKKRVLIPNVCRHFNVPCIDRNQFLRDINFAI